MRALRITGIALGVALLVMAAIAGYMFQKLTALPHPVPAEAAEDTRPLRPLRPARETARAMRLHLLHTAETTVPYGQFYRGLEGWVGAAAVWKGGLQREILWAPVAVAVIVHPEHGVVLVDTGLSEAQTRPFRHYSVLAGGLNAGIWRDSSNRITADGDLVSQLEALGFGADDVRHIVLTHLHEDHVGEVERFPHATVHVSRLEWEDRERVAYTPSFDEVTSWDHFEYVHGAFGPFAASYDLFGDRSVVVLPTPGHTLGHSVVVAQLAGGAPLVTGDALYTLRHLDFEAIASFNYFGPEGLATYQDSVRRIAALSRERGDLVLVVPHDPFEYGIVHIRRVLADGRITAPERTALREEQARLFDAKGRLRPDARPGWDAKTERAVSEIP